MGLSSVNEKDPRVKRTRQLLLTAFNELAAEKDIRSISVQDIAGRATLNRATFYAHFRDKEALMDTAFRSRIQALLEANLPPCSPLTKENFRLLFHLVCEFLNTTVRLCPRSVGERHPLMKVAVQEELYMFILNWLKQRLPQEDEERFPRERLAALLSWSLFGTTLEWISKPAQISQQAMAEQVVDLLMEGLGSAIPI